jgi:hypothetical protein
MYYTGKISVMMSQYFVPLARKGAVGYNAESHSSFC